MMQNNNALVPMRGTSALFLIDFISIRVMLEFERSYYEENYVTHHCVSIRVSLEFERSHYGEKRETCEIVSIRVMLEFEKSIMSINFMIMIASQSEFCWSLRDHIINNKITSKFLSQFEFCWSLRDLFSQ